MSLALSKFQRDYLAAWNSHDWDNLLDFFTDDCVYEDVAREKVLHGKTEMKDCFLSIDPDFHLEIKSIFSAGNFEASEWVMSGTNTIDAPGLKATQKKYSIRGASIIKYRDNKIYRQTDYWSLAKLIQQLGAEITEP